jgi:hypothetical protein
MGTYRYRRATGRRQANQMSFESQYWCFIVAYRVNKEQREEQKLFIQTPTFKVILKLVYDSLPTKRRQ